MKFQEQFKKKMIPELAKELKVKNQHAVPRIEKVKINVSIGSYLAGSKDYSQVVKNVTDITGQKPLVTLSRKAISNFKLKIGMPVGITVTLRKKKMYDFLSKLINIVFPRTRDFRGLSARSFDGHGNYSLGIAEYTVFPEIHPEDVTKNHGVEVTIVTTSKNNENAYKLLKTMGFPFKKDENLPRSKK
ncbi:50S ribosomal protein L5 [Candidatus Peregrinibacteria bacterium]|nr:50S ribosomal protein L5 [Candidatus Peregrinibacteria bacterium]